MVFRHDQDIIVGPEHDHERRNALEWVRGADGVLLSDYDKGFLTREFVAQVAELCRRCGIPCVADAKREPEFYAGCILKGNEEWAKKYAAEIDEYNGIIIVTRGSLPPIMRDNRAKQT